MPLWQREEVQEMLRLPGSRGEVSVTEETTAFANAMIFDGVSAELRGGPDRRAVFQGGTRVAEQDARLVLLPRTGSSSAGTS